MSKPFFRRFTKKFFIAANLIVCILFLLGNYGHILNPVRWWFLGLLTLSLPYLIVLLIVFLLFWLFLRKVWLIISLATLVSCWGTVRNIYPLNFAGNFNMEKLPGSIRVMSWNVEHFAILEHKSHSEIKMKMIDLINQYQPDVACFQEMVGGESKKAINNIQALQQSLAFPYYFYSFEHKFDFDNNHHFGIIIFSKYSLIDSQTIKNPPVDYNNIFQYVDLKVNADTLRIFNIHLQSLRFTQSNRNYLDNPGIGRDSDLTQSKNVISKLKIGFLKRVVQADRISAELVKSPYPLIICGDFNDVPESYAYCTIGNGLQNAFVKKGTGIGRTFTSISPTLRIDNIFAGQQFAVQQVIRIAQKLSDHFPVVADLSIHSNN